MLPLKTRAIFNPISRENKHFTRAISCNFKKEKKKKTFKKHKTNKFISMVRMIISIRTEDKIILHWQIIVLVLNKNFIYN